VISADDLLSRLTKVKKQRGYWVACCPAHPDRSPSMSVRDMGDGLAVKCFSTEGSCTTADIAKAVGLEPSDLQADRDDKAKILDTYPYHGPDGELVFEVVRYVPKSFKQRRPTGDGKWEWNLTGVTRYPYRLPELREGIDQGRWVFVVEGEKDVHRLEAEGLVATTTPGGAGNWSDDFAQWFSGGLVAIVPDNDTQGEEYAARAADAISRTAREVRIVKLDGVQPKGDVNDWLYAHTAAELQELVRITTAHQGGATVPTVTVGQANVEMGWPASAVRAVVDRLNWQSGQVHGEVSIYWNNKALIEYQRVNTQSASARRELVTELNRYDRDMEWHEILAQLFAQAVRRYRTVGRLTDMRDRPPADPPSFFVGDYWPDMPRPSLLFGDGESAKSTISLALLLSLASGRSLVGDKAMPSRRCPCGFIDYEDDETLFSFRLQSMARAAGINLADCEPIYYYRPDAALHQIADSLQTQIEDQGIEGLVIDSRSGAQSGSLNNDDDTRTFIDAVVHLGGRSWIIDHLDKESTRRNTPAKHSYGSVFLRNRVVSSWFAKKTYRTQSQTTVTMTDAKWNHGPERPARSIVVDWTAGGVRIDRRSEPIFASETASDIDRIVGWVYEHQPVQRLVDIADALNINKGTVSRLIKSNPDLIHSNVDGYEVNNDLPDPW